MGGVDEQRDRHPEHRQQRDCVFDDHAQRGARQPPDDKRWGRAGQPYAFDAYSDGATTVWVCLTVGTAVSSRVIVPISVSGPTVGPLITWYPDPGTP